MVQTRFDVLQTTLQVVSELQMAPAQRQARGEQFTLTLIVSDGGNQLPYDIYVDRLEDGEHGVVFVSRVNRSVVLTTTASIVPDEEKFDIEIIFDRSKDLSAVRPQVWVPPEMFKQVRAMLDRQFSHELLDLFIEDPRPPQG